MSEGSETYYSKILLFGEYTLMMGSKALAIPFSRYSGRLKLISKDIPEHLLSNRYLRDFYFYLVNNRDKFPAGFDFDLNEFKSDINKGLFFDSDIPQGYGVGSSGALVASVFNAYSGIRYMSLQEDQLPDLKRYFSFMESCFHGKSSGLDPLISYINKPILVSSSEKIEMVCFPNNEIKSDYEIFLLDTEITSSTELLVQKFMENLNDESYKNLIVSGLIPQNESCVDSLLHGRITEFMKKIELLSTLQLECFDEMISDKYREFWMEGLITGEYYLKLCGSGGGGFILGFTRDFTNTESYFRKNGVKLVQVFNSR